MSVSVSFQNVTKRFDGEAAVHDVTLTVEPGELFFLLGPSGCGKTTLLRCLAGFYHPEEGSIRLGERDVTAMPPHLRDTGMVFQSYALWPHMTLAENVAFGLQMRHLPKAEIAQRVEEALAMVRMVERARHKPNQLSGGQQQRIALARALVIRPQCLLLDEPLSNLDAKLRLEMRSEIRRICKEAGLTAIYVTHDQKEALSIADRLAIMDRGSIRQIGPPRDVYERPLDRFVANFIGESNFLPGHLVESANGTYRIDTPVGTFLSRVPPPCGLTKGDAVTLSLRPEVIRLGEPPVEADNRFVASVHDTLYLGEMAQHQVRLSAAASGGEAVDLKVFDMNPKIIARDRAEDTALWIGGDDVVILKN